MNIIVIAKVKTFYVNNWSYRSPIDVLHLEPLTTSKHIV